MFAGPTLTLFRVRGIPVGAHWSLFVALALMAAAHGRTAVSGDWWPYAAGLLLASLAFASVLLHEFGHAIVAQRRKVPIVGIDLHLMGGVAKMGAPPRSPADEVAISLAGPAVSLLLAAIFGAWAFLGREQLVAAPAFVGWLTALNFGVGVFNLLPALPMDGGRVARAILAGRYGLVVGTRRAVWLARALAFAIAVLGVFTNPWLIAISVLILWMGREELAAVREHAALHSLGYRDDAIDPWARYHRAADRERGVREGPRLNEAPEILVRQKRDASDDGLRDITHRPHTQRFVQDAEGRWMVVSEPVSTS